MQNYYGLIELLLTFGGVSLFVLWQMRQLNRDIKVREAREAREAKSRESEQKSDGET